MMIFRYAMPMVIAMLLSVTSIGLAQQHEVTGVVTDVNTEATLPGVNVVIQGTSQGTTTDLDGAYSISVPSSDVVLVFSYIGYESLEVAIEGRSEVNVELSQDIFEADEVVVVGYGTQHRWQVTGAISSVDMSQINDNLPNTNVAQSLSGVAGVNFISDGRPGQGGNILIRGQNSLSASNAPLIVLDGIIFNGDLSDINPQDIATLEVLKDASSTAIYGSRAANGVILINSKAGAAQKPIININFYSAISDPSNQLKLLNADRYIERRLDWRRQSGLEADPNNIESYLHASEAENFNNGISTNPWDIISQRGSINSIDISVSGMSDNINYLLSTSYSDERGLIYNDNQEKINLRANIEFNPTNWLRLGTNTMYAKRDQSGRSASMNNNSPFATYYYPDGEPEQYAVAEEQAGGNPMFMPLLTTNEEIYNNLFSNLYAVLEGNILSGNLSYRVNYSPNLQWDYDYNYIRQHRHLSINTTGASKFNRNSFNWDFENILTYQGDISQDHSFDITLLYGRRHSELEFTNANAGQLNFDGLGFHNLGLGSSPEINSYSERVDGVSYMGRINYQIKDRYLLTVTARRDGSSVFAEQNKYATLPSAALAWIVSDEPFMQDVNAFNFLKVRLSHGAVGNEAIQPYQSLSLSETTRYVFGSESALGIISSTLGNDDLKWETTTTTNAGIDFEMFDGRLGGTLEVYNSVTRDLLVRRSIPIMSGFDNILTNIGEVNNRGIEISLSSHNIRRPNFLWSNTISASYNRNRIVHLFGTDLTGDGREDDSIANSWFIGHPIHSYYDYVFDGIYQVDDTDIPTGLQPGDVKVKDINGDGQITPADRQVLGSGGTPKFQFGLTNRFSYKNFDLSIFVNAMLGWDATFNLINPRVPGRALNQLDAGWWTSENRSNSRPSLIYTNPLGTNWYLSRNFLRIRDVSLSYEFEQATLNRLGLTNLRLFLSAKNIYTFTNWLGSDPENAGDYGGTTTNNMYPMPRIVSLGINIGL